MKQDWWKYRSPLGYEYWSQLPPDECADKMLEHRNVDAEPKD